MEHLRHAEVTLEDLKAASKAADGIAKNAINEKKKEARRSLILGRDKYGILAE